MNPLLKIFFPEFTNMDPKAATARFESARRAAFRNRPGLWVLLFVASAALGVLPLLVLWIAIPGELQANAALRTLAIGLVPAIGLIAWTMLSARTVRSTLQKQPEAELPH